MSTRTPPGRRRFLTELLLATLFFMVLGNAHAAGEVKGKVSTLVKIPKQPVIRGDRCLSDPPDRRSAHRLPLLSVVPASQRENTAQTAGPAAKAGPKNCSPIRWAAQQSAVQTDESGSAPQSGPVVLAGAALLEGSAQVRAESVPVESSLSVRVVPREQESGQASPAAAPCRPLSRAEKHRHSRLVQQILYQIEHSPVRINIQADEMAALGEFLSSACPSMSFFRLLQQATEICSEVTLDGHYLRHDSLSERAECVLYGLALAAWSSNGIGTAGKVCADIGNSFVERSRRVWGGISSWFTAAAPPEERADTPPTDEPRDTTGTTAFRQLLITTWGQASRLSGMAADSETCVDTLKKLEPYKVKMVMNKLAHFAQRQRPRAGHMFAVSSLRQILVRFYTGQSHVSDHEYVSGASVREEGLFLLKGELCMAGEEASESSSDEPLGVIVGRRGQEVIALFLMRHSSVYGPAKDIPILIRLSAPDFDRFYDRLIASGVLKNNEIECVRLIPR